MKNLSVLVTGIAVMLGSAAYAADLPVKANGPAMAASNWTGFYVGANVGYGSARVNPGLLGGTDTVSGVFGGGQIGYNWQPMGSPLVLGVEGDIQAAGLNNNGVGFTEKSNWFGTLRGRAGYAIGGFMPYITGGGIWADSRASVTGIGSGSTTADGWTLGGGVEWMFIPRWSVKAEYLHADYGNTTTVIGGIPATAKITEDLGRFGVNYHF